MRQTILMEPGDRKKQVIIAAIVLLAAALGFALGYLVVPKQTAAPILIQTQSSHD